jgi:hypothetical protein
VLCSVPCGLAAELQRGRPKCQLIDDIKEQWAHDKDKQENLQKVLAVRASRHETTNWLKRAECGPKIEVGG